MYVNITLCFANCVIHKYKKYERFPKILAIY